MQDEQPKDKTTIKFRGFEISAIIKSLETKPTMKVKLSKSQRKLLKKGSCLITGKGDTFYYLPYWYKKTNEKGVYEEITYDHLPNELSELLKQLRNG